MENQLYAGYHKLVVTPPMGVKVPGYFQVRIADGILTDLNIRAVAFSNAEKKAIILSCDAITMSNAAADDIKKLISQRCNVEEGYIFIHCVHSHTAFRILRPQEEEGALATFLTWLQTRFADCAQFAFEDLKPATLRYAVGTAKGVGFIRTYHMRDGSIKTNPGFSNPDIVKPVSLQDETVQLVRIPREGGKEILLTNFGTHADVIGGTKFCADWPGYLCDTLEAAFSGQVEAVTLVGAQGNSNHLDFSLPKGTKYKSVDTAKRMARTIAGEVLKLYDNARESQGSAVMAATTEAIIGKNPYDPADVPEAEQIKKLYEELKNNTDPVFKTFSMPVHKALRILRNLSKPEFFHIPVYGLRLGGIAFVGVPCEPFQYIGSKVRGAGKLDMTVFTCLTNGSNGYFPDAVTFSLPGSYEGDSSSFAPDCAEKMVEAGKKVLEQLEK